MSTLFSVVLASPSSHVRSAPVHTYFYPATTLQSHSRAFLQLLWQVCCPLPSICHCHCLNVLSQGRQVGCRKCDCSSPRGQELRIVCSLECLTLIWFDYSSICSLFFPARETHSQIHTVGPIDVSDSIGKEVVARLQCGIASASALFTDSNGREMMRRLRNFVPTWNMSAHDVVPVNFYPVTSAAYIQDDTNRMYYL